MYKSQDGFTLIELLIVMLIISILLGITLASPVSGTVSRTKDEQSSLLITLFSQVRDKALLENREYGFSITDNSYQWWQLSSDNLQWQPLTDYPFQPRTLPDLLSLELHAELTQKKPTDPGPEVRQPDIVIFSDHQITPFKLLLEGNDRSQIILATDGLSDVRVSD